MGTCCSDTPCTECPALHQQQCQPHSKPVGSVAQRGLQDGDAQRAEDGGDALLRSPLPPGVDPQYSRQAVQSAHAAGVALRDSLQHPAECKVKSGVNLSI